jgi:hypothetical protein
MHGKEYLSPELCSQLAFRCVLYLISSATLTLPLIAKESTNLVTQVKAKSQAKSKRSCQAEVPRVLHSTKLVLQSMHPCCTHLRICQTVTTACVLAMLTHLLTEGNFHKCQVLRQLRHTEATMGTAYEAMVVSTLCRKCSGCELTKILEFIALIVAQLITRCS